LSKENKGEKEKKSWLEDVSVLGNYKYSELA